jgi:hypothetical protein
MGTPIGRRLLLAGPKTFTGDSSLVYALLALVRYSQRNPSTRDTLPGYRSGEELLASQTQRDRDRRRETAMSRARDETARPTGSCQRRPQAPLARDYCNPALQEARQASTKKGARVNLGDGLPKTRTLQDRVRCPHHMPSPPSPGKPERGNHSGVAAGANPRRTGEVARTFRREPDS